ncbi:MAG: hypothetical protein WD065_12600 [Planctomycetaceae bacterium]
MSTTHVPYGSINTSPPGRGRRSRRRVRAPSRSISEAAPDTGDIYSGFDRFGRVKDSRWYDYGSAADVDRIKYGYDRNSNRIWRQNTVADALGKHFDELYGYDLVNRLKDLDRGTLNGGKDGVTDLSFAECWALDQTGNWKNYRQDDDGSGTWDLNQHRRPTLSTRSPTSANRPDQVGSRRFTTAPVT